MENERHKQNIRSKYLTLRENLRYSERINKSKAIWKRIKEQTEFQEAEVVLVYMDYRSEVITTGFVEELLLMENPKRIFAPVVEGYDIKFYEIFSLSDLHSGYQSIREPEIDVKKEFTKDISMNKKCFLLAPGSVYDRDHYRMGYGKGFYDRFFIEYPEITKAGLAFDCQIAPVHIPATVDDQKVDMVITETERI